jgi:two-component system OmpR family response regulator
MVSFSVYRDVEWPNQCQEASRRLKILLIEDDGENADYVANGLREEGHSVAQVASGAEGLISAMGNGFDLLIVDRMIPGLDGLTLVKSLRAAGHHTPVLFLTALGGVEDRVSGLVTITW